MKYVLGISALYHDSAAALLGDGRIVAAAQEERFTRVKHDAAFPHRAIAYCLGEAGISAGDLTYVCYYEKPLRTFDRLLETWLARAPLSFDNFRLALPSWLREKLRIGRAIRKALPGYSGAVVYTDHHESHAASAFFPSPFEEAAVLTCDGVGEWATTTWGVGRGGRVELSESLNFPHSLGLLYSAFTTFCGFKVLSGEYKLMGLAPYGRPVYAQKIFDELIDLKADGSFRLDMDKFTFETGRRMTGAAFEGLFGGPAREAESPITRRELDLAASIQAVTEEVLQRITAHIHKQTGLDNLCLAGGVALNCVANGRLQREGPFKRLWIQPAAGDAGGALGAALLCWHQLMERPRVVSPGDAQQGSLLGPAHDAASIRATLDSAGAVYEFLPDEAALLALSAERLDEGDVVGWFQGRAEYGPRALGNRSILGDARRPEMQRTMNLKIKQRESFRPFAPAVLAERAHDLFALGPAADSPYMLMVAPVIDATPAEDPGDAELLARLSGLGSALPAVTHVDGSARVQTVDPVRHGRFRRLLEAFDRRTGTPALVNTSFNVRGEPIVDTPADALRCFLHTDMDTLVIGDFLLRKASQPEFLLQVDREAWLSRFELD
ncbi:MAG: carbamoyltransferase N-terminal domain-containing protein [Myxococcota bacterium]